MNIKGPIIVAIPVRNEETLICDCLDALAAQTHAMDKIILLLNNCTDRTLEICHKHEIYSNKIIIVERNLYGFLASAGEARRLAVEYALSLAGNGIILTTDADAIPNPQWIEKNILALEKGADAVCGMAEINPSERNRQSEAMRFDDERVSLLLNLQDNIDALVDPDSADPWPRHQQQSGASIAVCAAFLRMVGGAPHVAVGEDRALIKKLRLFDAHIRHALDIIVQVSGRFEGRAAGGMAETMKRRMIQQDELTDERLEPTVDAYRRAVTKFRLRGATHSNPAEVYSLADDLLISHEIMSKAMQGEFFGKVWADIQRLSPVLKRRRIAFTNLDREIDQTLFFCDQLKHELSSASCLPRHNFSTHLNLSGYEVAR